MLARLLRPAREVLRERVVSELAMEDRAGLERFGIGWLELDRLRDRIERGFELRLLPENVREVVPGARGRRSGSARLAQRRLGLLELVRLREREPEADGDRWILGREPMGFAHRRERALRIARIAPRHGESAVDLRIGRVPDRGAPEERHRLSAFATLETKRRLLEKSGGLVGGKREESLELVASA